MYPLPDFYKQQIAYAFHFLGVANNTSFVVQDETSFAFPFPERLINLVTNANSHIELPAAYISQVVPISVDHSKASPTFKNPFTKSVMRTCDNMAIVDDWNKITPKPLPEDYWKQWILYDETDFASKVNKLTPAHMNSIFTGKYETLDDDDPAIELRVAMQTLKTEIESEAHYMADERPPAKEPETNQDNDTEMDKSTENETKKETGSKNANTDNENEDGSTDNDKDKDDVETELENNSDEEEEKTPKKDSKSDEESASDQDQEEEEEEGPGEPEQNKDSENEENNTDEHHYPTRSQVTL